MRFSANFFFQPGRHPPTSPSPSQPAVYQGPRGRGGMEGYSLSHLQVLTPQHRHTTIVASSLRWGCCSVPNAFHQWSASGDVPYFRQAMHLGEAVSSRKHDTHPSSLLRFFC